MIKIFQVKKILHGEVVVKQGDPIENFYLIRSGKFSVDFVHKNKIQTGFNINYFNEINNERFTTKRRSELTGIYDADEELKVLIYSCNLCS